MQVTTVRFATWQAELDDQVRISASLEDLCDQNVIVYLLRMEADKYMRQVASRNPPLPPLSPPLFPQRYPAEPPVTWLAVCTQPSVIL